MGCGKSKLGGVATDATITKTKSKSTKKIDHQGSKKVAKDAKTVPDKVETALAPQQTEGGSEKIESATEKPKEESPAAAAAGDVEAENGGAEAAHDVDKKDDSNSPKIKGEPLGVTRIVGIDAVVEAEKPKDVVEEKAPVEEAKTEAVSEAPVAVEEKEPEAAAVLAVEAEASTPTPSPAPAQDKKETETEAEAVKAAEEEKETEAVALPVEPEAPTEPAQDKEETEVAAATPVEPEASAPTTTEEEKIPADEEVAAPAAASPAAADTKTN